MGLFVAIVGYLGVVLHGLALLAQAMTLGGVLFLVFLMHPLADAVAGGAELERRVARVVRASALGLALAELAGGALQVGLLIGTVELPFADAVQAPFAIAGGARTLVALLLLACLHKPGRWSAVAMLALVAALLVAATFTTHAYARLIDRGPLMLADGLHQFGAAIWIGGIPYFVLVLGRLHDVDDWRRVGARFSRMAMLGVACIVVSGAAMATSYLGDVRTLYGTAYGVMVGAKSVMFLALLALGFGNLLVTERLRRHRHAPVLRLRRFAEVEIGIGFTIFFAAASLTSAPPAIDMVSDRVGWHEIAARNAPAWPRLSSPAHDQLALARLQAQLDRATARPDRSVASASVPGSDDPPPRNAEDLAWSEYNHHWAGVFMLAIGLLALLNRGGVGWLRHWPLLLLAMAAFLLLRSDPEVWPLGREGFWAAWRDVEVAQHRLFVLLVALFGLFEWAVRTGRLRDPRAALAFPLLVAASGALLLTHTHQIADLKEQLLIELSHTPLALTGVTAGWARWLELRLPGRGGAIAGWLWPVCLMLAGVILLWYREA